MSNPDTEYSGIELSLGSVRGYRSWKVTIEGKLEPLHHGGSWLPGENRAVCHGSPSSDLIARPDYNDKENYPETSKAYYRAVNEWRESHEFDSCTHGFYAFFEGTDRYQSSEPIIHGTIEGYGEVLIGTKGFRAMKAKILALSYEPYGGMWNLDEFVVNRIRRNYPNVPLFESSLAMLVEFPADEAKTFEKVSA